MISDLMSVPRRHVLYVRYRIEAWKAGRCRLGGCGAEPKIIAHDPKIVEAAKTAVIARDLRVLSTHLYPPWARPYVVALQAVALDPRLHHRRQAVNDQIRRAPDVPNRRKAPRRP